MMIIIFYSQFLVKLPKIMEIFVVSLQSWKCLKCQKIEMKIFNVGVSDWWWQGASAIKALLNCGKQYRVAKIREKNF